MPIRIDADMLRGTGARCGGTRIGAVDWISGEPLLRRFCFGIKTSFCTRTAKLLRPLVSKPPRSAPDRPGLARHR